MKVLRRIDFNTAYKALRNRFRPYRIESVLKVALQQLNQDWPSRLEELKQIPWQQLLLVKWVCQEGGITKDIGRELAPDEYHELRQRLHDFPEQIDLGVRDTLPGRLFMRQLLHQQIGFQRQFSKGFVREGALLAAQPANSLLRRLFEEKTGLLVEEFLDLSLATYVAILSGKKTLDVGWFSPLANSYSQAAIDAYVRAISCDCMGLRRFFCALPETAEKQKLASEYFEFPVIKRYPFLRTGRTLECWHPMVFFRGMEGFVHTVLSEAGNDYMNRFSKLFEDHVIAELKKLPVYVLDEQEMTKYLTPGAKVPDGLMAFPECNVLGVTLTLTLPEMH